MRIFIEGTTKYLAIFAVAVTAALSGCAQAPGGPTVQAVPGPNKSLADFQQDNGYCRTFASSQISDAQNQANQQVVSSVVVGAFTGNAAPVPSPSETAVTLQQRYDAAFVQCMFAKGESIPGMSPPTDYATNGAARPSYDPLVRSIQAELVRTGYLRGGVDGEYGPATRSAILSFQRANGLSADASATRSLLSRLRSAPGASSGAVASSGTLVQPVTGPGGASGSSSGLVQPISAPGAGAPPPAGSGLVAPVTGNGAPKNP
jgi:hypothetical protein